MSDSIGHLLEDVPIGDMVRSLGKGLMETQLELDLMSLRATQMMSGKYQVTTIDVFGKETVEDRDSLVNFDGERLSLLELGLTPTFYQMVEAQIQIKVSICMTREASLETSRSSSTSSGSGDVATTRATSVDARFASRFGFSAVGSSVMTTKLAPVPPPQQLMTIVQMAAGQEAP